MARELVLNASIAYLDTRAVAVLSEVVNRRVSPSVTTKKPSVIVQNVGTAEEVLNLGDNAGVSCIVLIRNLDPTNYVEIRTGTGALKFAKLRPDTNQDGTGGFAFFEFGSGLSTPYVIADTAACDIEIFVSPAA